MVSLFWSGPCLCLQNCIGEHLGEQHKQDWTSFWSFASSFSFPSMYSSVIYYCFPSLLPSPHPSLLFSPLPFFIPLSLYSPHLLSLKLSSPWPFLLQGLRILGLVEGLDSPSVGVTWEGPHQGSNGASLSVTWVTMALWLCHFCQPPQAPGIPCITVFQSTFPWDEFNGLIKVTLCTNWEVSEALRQLSCIYTHKVLTAEQGRQFKTQKHPWVNYFLLVCHIFLRYDCSFRRWQQQLTIKLCTLFYLYFLCLSILFVLFFSSFPLKLRNTTSNSSSSCSLGNSAPRAFLDSLSLGLSKEISNLSTTEGTTGCCSIWQTEGLGSRLPQSPSYSSPVPLLATASCLSSNP